MYNNAAAQLHKCCDASDLCANKTRLGGPTPGFDVTLAHGGNALGVVAGAVGGVSVGGLAGRTGVVGAEGAVDGGELLLLLGGGEHVGGSLRGPTVDEVAVRAPGGAAGELEGRGAAPAVGEDLAEVVADGEAELRHGLHAGGAAATALGLVGGLEGLGVDTLGEVEELLEVGAAGRRGETVGVGAAAAAVLAGPRGLGIGDHVALGGGGGLAGNHLEVLGNSDLGLCLAKVVVGAEARERHGLVGLAAVGGVERRGDPVDGQVVGVLGVGAALLELGAGLGVDGDGVGAEEGVQVRLVVLAGVDNGIDVLGHKRGGDVDLGVGLSQAGEEAGSEKKGRHPVSVKRTKKLKK